MSDMKVWIGSLAAYNEGNLWGDWFDAIDAPTTAREWVDHCLDQEIFPAVVVAAIRGATEGLRERALSELALYHEEIWVFDHEGFDGWLDGECSPAQAKRLAELVRDIVEAGHDPEVVAAWVSDFGVEFSEWDGPTEDAFMDAYEGTYSSERDFAENLADNLGYLEKGYGWPHSCIDWEWATRELMMDYSAARVTVGVAIFRL